MLEREFSKTTPIVAGTAALAFDAVTTSAPTDGEKSASKEELPNEEFYTLDLEGALTTASTENVPIEPEEKIQANLAEVEDLFRELEEDKEPIPQATLATNNEASILDLQETLNGGVFPEIPLEVLDTDVDVAGKTNFSSNGSPTPLVEEEGLEINPIPKTKFSTWFRDSSNANHFNGFDLIGYNSKGLIEELIQNKKTQTDKTATEERMEMEEDIASETLAQILVIQGHYEKAIQMLERLKLLYPEKNSFFVAEIQKIQNLEQEKTL